MSLQRLSDTYNGLGYSDNENSVSQPFQNNVFYNKMDAEYRLRKSSNERTHTANFDNNSNGGGVPAANNDSMSGPPLPPI